MTLGIDQLAILDGNGAAKNLVVFSDPDGNLVPSRTGDSSLAHYGYAFTVATAAIPTAPTDLITITGSATTGVTVRVKEITLFSTATASQSTPFSLVKRSTVGTGGTAATAIVAVPLDSQFAAASGVVKNWTTLQSPLGTAVGSALAFVPFCAIDDDAVVAAQTTGVTIRFGVDGVPACVLRGVAESLNINFAGATKLGAGGILYVKIITAEDAS